MRGKPLWNVENPFRPRSCRIWRKGAGGVGFWRFCKGISLSYGEFPAIFTAFSVETARKGVLRGEKRRVGIFGTNPVFHRAVENVENSVENVENFGIGTARQGETLVRRAFGGREVSVTFCSVWGFLPWAAAGEPAGEMAGNGTGEPGFRPGPLPEAGSGKIHKKSGFVHEIFTNPKLPLNKRLLQVYNGVAQKMRGYGRDGG